jgi:uncharacterized protein GlcG (DUF336 family)
MGKRHRRNHWEDEMSYRIAAGVALALAASMLAVHAQGVRIDRNVSMDLASAIMAAAMDRCSKDGYQVSVAVVDRAGHMIAFLRADGSAPHTAELARRKAYTARTFRRSSLEWAKRSEEPAFAGQRSLADVIALGGGLPIAVGDDTIGGVGVSGAPGQEKDEACARAALAKVADQLK